MCGIVGFCGKRVAAPIVFDGLKRVEYRGYDSAGIATSTNGKLAVKKDVGSLDEVNGKYALSEMSGNMAIGHTRWCTHGAATLKNAHPHCDCTGTIAVVHNGIIENYQELRQQLIGRGHRFVSETDTEVIPHLIEEEMKVRHSLGEAVVKIMSKLDGYYAFLAISSQGQDEVVGARHGNPLVIGVSAEGNYVASDVLSFLHHTNEILDMADGEMVVITAGGVYFTGANGKTIEKQSKRVNGEVWLSDKGRYPHYMLKEINELPQAVLNASRQDKGLFANIAMDILRAKQVIITACGTSRYAALIGRYLFSKVGRKFCDVVMASEFHYFADSIDKDTLVLAVSQSGETADVIRGVDTARIAGARVVSIVNRPMSMLADRSHHIIYLNCGSEISVPATKSFLSQLGVFYLLAHSMTNSFEATADALEKISEEITRAIQLNDTTINTLAQKLKDRNDWYFIARGINYAIASEGALKLKEVSYAHAEGMPAGELKHGTLSLIEDGTPVVAICPNDYTFRETLANAIEAKSRGGYIIGVSDEENEIYDFSIKLPSVEEDFYPLVAVPPLYLLAYYMSIKRGHNPDRPRNLAKSVTVQ